MNIDTKTTTVSLAVVVAIVGTVWVGGGQWSSMENRIVLAQTDISDLEKADTEINQEIDGIQDQLEENERAVLLLKDQVRGLREDVSDANDNAAQTDAEILRLLRDLRNQ